MVRVHRAFESGCSDDSSWVISGVIDLLKEGRTTSFSFVLVVGGWVLVAVDDYLELILAKMFSE